MLIFQVPALLSYGTGEGERTSASRGASEVDGLRVVSGEAETQAIWQEDEGQVCVGGGTPINNVGQGTQYPGRIWTPYLQMHAFLVM